MIVQSSPSVILFKNIILKKSLGILYLQENFIFW